MEHYAGIDVSLESSSVCVVDASGKIVREAKVASEPEALIAWFRGARVRTCADRAGGGAAVAMAVCGDARGGSCGGAAGDAARARCFQGDAGQDRPQRRARDRAADAARLVPAGALQVAAGAGGARAADGAQAGASEAARRGDEPARHAARLRPEGRADDAGSGSPGGSGSWSPATRRWRCIAEALLAVHETLLRELRRLGEAGASMARAARAGAAVDVDAGRRRDRGAHLCRRRSTIRRGSDRRRRSGRISG